MLRLIMVFEAMASPPVRNLLLRGQLILHGSGSIFASGSLKNRLDGALRSRVLCDVVASFSVGVTVPLTRCSQWSWIVVGIYGSGIVVGAIACGGLES